MRFTYKPPTPLEKAAPELLAACQAAERARQSFSRNLPYLKAALQAKGQPSEWLEGVMRNLDHARAAIAKAMEKGN